MADAERTFERTTVVAWPDVQVAVRPLDEHAVVVTATCPLCGHHIDDFVHVEAPSVGAEISTVLACNCESEHKGRPEGVLGCGAISAVKITVEGQTGGRIEVTGPASLRERYWDQESAGYERTMTTRMAGIAEKWGQTVAAIFGLFGIALILEGNDVLGDLTSSTADWPFVALACTVLAAGVATLAWTRQRETKEQQFDGQAFAAGALTAAVGALGLLALIRWDTPFDAAVSFGIGAGIAVALALAATAFAGLAAQGTPKRIANFTGGAMRARLEEIAGETVRDLMRARFLTVWATIFLGLAVCIMWFAPQQTTAATNVRLTLLGTGAQPCGELAATAGRRFAIDPGGGKPVEFYDFSRVVRLDPVADC